MLKEFVLGFLATILIAGLVAAHDDPIMGTVSAVTNDTLTITGKENKPLTIRLEEPTKYLMDGKPAKKDALKPGVRVVIDAHMDRKTKMYAAEEVQIGAFFKPGHPR
jgi:hypothetical protein